MTKFYIVDEMMGRGKTSAAINMMNSTGKKYMFVTPYLSEVERIKKDCIGFEEPISEDGKLGALKELILENKNIVTTHALFRLFDVETIEMLKERNYTLVVDEELDAVEKIEITEWDLSNVLYRHANYNEETHLVTWENNEYKGKYEIYMNMCNVGDVYKFGSRYLYRMLPKSLFDTFEEVYILTYLFQGSVFEKYIQASGFTYERVFVEKDGGKYRFSSNAPIRKKDNLYDLINIVDNYKMNNIGNSRSEAKHILSKQWCKERATEEDINQIKRNLKNFFIHMCNSKSKDNMWTTFKDFKEKIKGGGYSKGFIPFNIRATNEYRGKTNVAFLVNIYLNPNIKNLFRRKGIDLSDDAYALSILVQFIWRSAIRDGKPINLYIPAWRMRKLLMEWINENTSGEKRYDIKKLQREYEKSWNRRSKNLKEWEEEQ